VSRLGVRPSTPGSLGLHVHLHWQVEVKFKFKLFRLGRSQLKLHVGSITDQYQPAWYCRPKDSGHWQFEFSTSDADVGRPSDRHWQWFRGLSVRMRPGRKAHCTLKVVRRLRLGRVLQLKRLGVKAPAVFEADRRNLLHERSRTADRRQRVRLGEGSHGPGFGTTRAAAPATTCASVYAMAAQIACRSGRPMWAAARTDLAESAVHMPQPTASDTWRQQGSTIRHASNRNALLHPVLPLRSQLGRLLADQSHASAPQQQGCPEGCDAVCKYGQKTGIAHRPDKTDTQRRRRENSANCRGIRPAG